MVYSKCLEAQLISLYVTCVMVYSKCLLYELCEIIRVDMPHIIIGISISQAADIICGGQGTSEEDHSST